MIAQSGHLKWGIDKMPKIGYLIKVDLQFMEAYRSGHNEPDSKSGCPHGHVSSNLTASAKSREIITISRLFFSYFVLYTINTIYSQKLQSL